ncbi:MAG: MFS transporter [Asticcacaulis sp.]|uniref:MFS transporter n=1 Tax=Asticcacaulis sp. TaxID=1872648 RepID=UPI0039E33290
MSMLVIIAAIVIFIYGMLASMLGTIVPGLGESLGLTTLQLSYLALAQGLGLAATSVCAGALMDRSGKKAGIVIGLVASVVGLGILSHAGSLTLGIAAMALLGVGGSLVIVGANALVNDVSDKNKASALNILNLFVGLGGMATPWVAGNLLHSDPTKVAYAGIGIALLALALTLFTAIPKPQPLEKATVGGVFGVGALYILSAVTFLYTACEFAMWNWLPKFLIGNGIPSVSALNILSLGFAGGILVGRFIAASVLARLSPWVVTLVSAIAMSAITFAILHTAEKTALYALVFAAGLAMAPVFPTTIAIVGRIFQQHSGTAIGFAITCGFSGLVVSSPVIGVLAGDTPQGIGRALLLIPVLSAVIALILILFRKPLTDTPSA